MENQTNTTSTKQIMLNYGLILGITTIFISVTNYALGDIYKPHWSVQVISILVFIALIVIGLKKVKENNGGYLTLNQSFKLGLGIALIGAIISIIYTFIFAKFIEPNFMSNVMELRQQAMLQSNSSLTDDQIEKSINIMSKFFFPFLYGGIFIGNLFFGFIISLIAGLIMKKSPEQDY